VSSRSLPLLRPRATVGFWRAAVALCMVPLGVIALAFWYSSPGSHCPQNARPDRVRALWTLALLASTHDGRAELFRLWQRPRLCFADVGEGVLQQQTVLIVPSSRSNRMNAARVAHLLLHQLDGAPLDERAARSGFASCDELVQRAMRRESSAHAIEARVGRMLGVSLDSSPPPGLARAYRTRCEALSAERGR
jgi:hypothetical protein